MKRYLFPILGIAIVAITIAEVNVGRASARPKDNNSRAEARPTSNRIAAEGRVVTYPGAEVSVGSDVGGTIASIKVNEKDRVKKGDVIALIRADDTRAAYAQARSRVGEAEADIRLYEAESARFKSLFEQQVGSKEAWEKAQRDLDAARARRGSAGSEVERLAALLDKTRVVAPIDGVVITRERHKGESVAAGETIVTIADLSRTRVEAEIDEFDSAHVVLGGRVRVSAEGFDKQWIGTIEEIPDSVVSRRLKPQDPSKPIDTRVLLVKVAMNEPTPLKLGQRVDIEIER
jgi:RND family efflux transporter MFP subunit